MQNLQLYTNRKIQIKTVDTPTATLVVAILVITEGNQITYSEPKIIRVISKQNPLLVGSVAHKALPAPQEIVLKKNHILSPYATIFSYSNSQKIAWLFARPPTRF